MWKSLYIIIGSARLIPHLLCYLISQNRTIITYDLERWYQLLRNRKITDLMRNVFAFIEIMSLYPEFRNLFYKRIGRISYLLKWLCRPLPTLYLSTKEIGPGLFLQHSFSTMIAAKRVGSNCWINQQVTIGYSNSTDCPTIGNNVTIYAGAKVIGKVTVGDNCVIEIGRAHV